LKTKLFALISTWLLAGTVHAGLILDTPILGGALLVVEDGHVQAQFLGSDAGYFNTLYLDTSSDWGTGKVFDKNSGINSIVDLGYFEAGTELLFRLYVSNTGLNFFSGDPTRNSDNLAHAQAITSALGTTYITLVGFEDLLGGGDQDYNDFMFSLTNVIDPPPGAAVPVPVPPVLFLLVTGLAGLLVTRRQQQADAA
tara:strand:- start:171873 stop:172463 length:591 start_codon:yes stop_codon:yes gene_type:complete